MIEKMRLWRCGRVKPMALLILMVGYSWSASAGVVKGTVMKM